MKKTLTTFLITFCILLSQITTAQWSSDFKYIDSIQRQLKLMKGDTAGVRLLNMLAAAYNKVGENEQCKKYAGMALQLIRSKLNTGEVKKNAAYLQQYKKLEAKAIENTGNGLLFENAAMAFDTLQLALKLWQQTGDKSGIASVHASIAEYFTNKGDHTASLRYYNTSLDLYKELGDKFNTGWVLHNIGLVQRYMGNYGDALENHVKTLQIGREINSNELMTHALLGNGFDYMLVKNFPEALKNQKEALAIFTSIKDSIGIGNVYYDIGVTHLWSGNLDEALVNHIKGLEIRKRLTNYGDIGNSYNFISRIYDKQGKYAEAIRNSLEGVKYTELFGKSGYILDNYSDAAEIYVKMSDYTNAALYYNKVLNLARNIKNAKYQAISLQGLAEIHLAQNNTAKAIELLHEAEAVSSANDYKTRLLIFQDLAAAYVKTNNYNKAYSYQVKYKEMSDSVANAEKIEKVTSVTNQLEFENKQALQKLSNDKLLSLKQSELKTQKIIKNISIAGLLMGLVLAAIFYIRFKEKKKLNDALEVTLSNLQSAQAQLVQSEKMASLGELTAGIAHEIQNPLNFVTNFSEVNKDLIAELKQELSKGNIADAIEISKDIQDNEEKIVFHGKRADAIVKGMLQHSRNNTGQIEPTDVNALADEFLRLSYHGLRAKDKSFNALMKTDFDNNLGKISIIPQDIGRVILNLITNAFHAVAEKKKQMGEGYEPIVWVSTKRLYGSGADKNKVEIKIRDNGTGIPKDVMDKIFQPFFTTKPSGQGTGLGLSLSYDIIKAHGGELKLETKEGEGSEFAISLPV
jgi:two-component system, NtrC family, sensor kinase